MMKYNILRQLLRNVFFKNILVSSYSMLRNIHWRLIKSVGITVKFKVNNLIGKLHPEGQIAEVLWRSNFESNERDFLCCFCQPGMHIANIGANVGLYTILTSIMVGSTGKVHAFEPTPLSYLRLLKNLKLNSCTNVVTNCVALSDSNGKLILRNDPENPQFDGHNFVEKIQTSDLTLANKIVEATTLDDYMETHKNQQLQLIVMDVEGFELAVLQGGIQTLSNNNLTLLMECSKHHSKVQSILTDLGYCFWVWDPVKRSLMPTDFKDATARGDVIVRMTGWSATK